MPTDVNHIDDPATKEKLKAAAMEQQGEQAVGTMVKKRKDLFSDKI